MVHKVMRAIKKEPVLDNDGLNNLIYKVKTILNRRQITKLSDAPHDQESRPIDTKPPTLKIHLCDELKNSIGEFTVVK